MSADDASSSGGSSVSSQTPSVETSTHDDDAASAGVSLPTGAPQVDDDNDDDDDGSRESQDDGGGGDDVLDVIYEDLRNAVEILEAKWTDDGVEFDFNYRDWVRFILEVADLLSDHVPTRFPVNSNIDEEFETSRRKVLEGMLEEFNL